jgi:hypothetical protein
MFSGKTEVTKKNKTFTMAEVKRLINNELDIMTQEDWHSCIRQALHQRQ